jgi:hypothetical protein
VAQPAARKLVRPDVEGAYVVEATVYTSDGQKTQLAQTFIGATYVGIGTCTMCHNGVLPENKVMPWSKTGHAGLFKSGIEGQQGDHYSAACISCHTTGYDANNSAPNGGFSAVATQLKWAFPAVKPGNFDAMPDALKNLSSIQCENCHGAGSVHVSGAFNIGLNVTSNSGVCAKCHDAPTHHIKATEWNNSVHAVVTTHPSGPGEEACVGCHQDTVHTRNELLKLGGGTGVPTQAVDVEELQKTLQDNQETIGNLQNAGQSRLYTGLIQGAIIGLMTGGAAAWVVSRRIKVVEDDDNE